MNREGVKDQKIAQLKIPRRPRVVSVGGGQLIILEPMPGVLLFWMEAMLDEPAGVRSRQNCQPAQRNRAIAQRHPDGVRRRRATDVPVVLMRRRRLCHVAGEGDPSDAQPVQDRRPGDDLAHEIEEARVLRHGEE